LNLCILSGKGGTGKTTVSTNLAALMGYHYIDCDVEEPNGFIFLKPTDIETQDVCVQYPVVDESKCTLCKACAKACQFHALVTSRKNVMVFDKLCHACGACMIVCEPDAISYGQRRIGRVESGRSGNILARRGILDVGEHMGVPIIKQMLGELPKGNNILDCPPGTSCNVVNTIAHADKAMLVTEPSVFGLHDLKLAVKLLRMRGLPFGVVINKHTGEGRMIEDYCAEEGIALLGSLPFRREAAAAYSTGGMLIGMSEYRAAFEKIAAGILEVV